MIFSNRPERNSLPGPDDITRRVLSNGMVVLTRANFNSPSVVIRGYLPVGGLLDPDEKLGLADFTAAALMRGTAHHDHQGIYDALESTGASLGFHASTHTVGFSARALVEDLELVLGLAAEVLRQPAFPERELEKLRAQLLTGLALRSQNTGEVASLTFDEIVYKGHPYRRPEDGYPDTVRAISRGDIVEFHQTHYGPRDCVIVVVGALESDVVLNKVAAVLGDWEALQQPEPPPLPPLSALDEVVANHVDVPGKSQTDLVIGVAGPPRRALDFIPAMLGNSVLGQFGMYGRIGEVVREQAGMAYYAYSSLAGGVGPGPWHVNAGVDPANVDRAIDLIRTEITRYVREPVTAEELEDTKANYVGRLPLALESNSGVASALINLERYHLGLDYYRRYAERVQAISPEMILEASRRYLDPDRLAIASAGSVL